MSSDDIKRNYLELLGRIRRLENQKQAALAIGEDVDTLEREIAWLIALVQVYEANMED